MMEKTNTTQLPFNSIMIEKADKKLQKVKMLSNIPKRYSSN